jgi:hypothetical protein
MGLCAGFVPAIVVPTTLRLVRRQEHPHPVSPNPGETRVGQPQK